MEPFNSILVPSAAHPLGEPSSGENNNRRTLEMAGTVVWWGQGRQMYSKFGFPALKPRRVDIERAAVN
jgi:hypothetical protein